MEHGANPGLVSHFTKQALEEIGTRVAEGRPSPARVAAVEAALADDRYNDLAHLLGVKVIHISERDTQITSQPKEVNEFVNTWSVEGFYEEGIAPAEMGWGTHEKRLPPLAYAARGRRPRQPDLPRPDGVQDMGALVGAGGGDHRHGDPPR